MERYSPLRGLAEEWAHYLQQHGHQAEKSACAPELLFSRNGQGRRYRWLLRHIEGDSLRLSPADRKALRRQIRLAHNAGEWVYLVVKFEQPAGTLLVIPATEAVKAKRLGSDKAGIPWDP